MKIFYYSSMVLIGGAILLLLGFYWQLLHPEPIIAFKQKTVPIQKKVYHPGDRVDFIVSYCKYVNAVGQNTISLTDGDVLPVYSDITYLPLGCHEITYPVVLTLATHPGVYHLTLRIDYHIGYLFFYGYDSVYFLQSENFTVE